MSDETNSVAPGSETLPGLEPALPPPAPPRSLTHWLRLLFVCNPFYLASAALLLFGVYRVSMDPHFLPTEVAQLVFNFSALQGYALLLVGTAIFLARRTIWYDATLLVVLENLFVLIPFILVSHAALIEQNTVGMLCLLAALLALARTEALRRQLKELMPALPALLAGAAVLLVNAVLPILYRHFHETKFGNRLESGDAYEFNRVAWLLLLPVLVSLAHLLPRPAENAVAGRRPRWFPLALFLFWLGGSGVHLYSLGYVYDFDLSRELLAPGVWALMWVLHSRLTDFLRTPPLALRTATLGLPLLGALLPASGTGSDVFLILSAINGLLFAWLAWRDANWRWPLHLSLISFATVLAALPVELSPSVFSGLARTELIGLAVCGYVILCTLLTRHPKAAILGALAAGLAVALRFEPAAHSLHWAVQAGLMFFLLHSLRWRDDEHAGAALTRRILALAWAVHTILWARGDVSLGQPLLPAAAVLGTWTIACLHAGRWRLRALPVAALWVALCAPIHRTLEALQSTPTGLLAMFGSLVLFAAGTAAALTRHHWRGNDSD